jgi:branched-chain amino acid transport system ATP-binding protein
MAYLQVNGITKRFGGIVAVDKVSFEVNEGEIIFDGKPIHNLKPQQIVKSGISRTFQNIRLFQDLRVVENVLVGTHIRTKYNLVESIIRSPKFKKEEDDKVFRAIEILKSIGLDRYRDDYAENLPYGDQRKLEIARAIATGAKLILLDEPAAGMNPQESDELLQFIRSLKQKGYTIIMIEHDMSVVMNISDRIYVIDHGKPIASGLPEEIANNERVIEAYLGRGRKNAKGE